MINSKLSRSFDTDEAVDSLSFDSNSAPQGEKEPRIDSEQSSTTANSFVKRSSFTLVDETTDESNSGVVAGLFLMLENESMSLGEDSFTAALAASRTKTPPASSSNPERTSGSARMDSSNPERDSGSARVDEPEDKDRYTSPLSILKKKPIRESSSDQLFGSEEKSKKASPRIMKKGSRRESPRRSFNPRKEIMKLRNRRRNKRGSVAYDDEAKSQIYAMEEQDSKRTSRSIDPLPKRAKEMVWGAFLNYWGTSDLLSVFFELRDILSVPGSCAIVDYSVCFGEDATFFLTQFIDVFPSNPIDVRCLEYVQHPDFDMSDILRVAFWVKIKLVGRCTSYTKKERLAACIFGPGEFGRLRAIEELKRCKWFPRVYVIVEEGARTLCRVYGVKIPMLDEIPGVGMEKMEGKEGVFPVSQELLQTMGSHSLSKLLLFGRD